MSALLYYILCGILSLGVLVGIKRMSAVDTAVGGNLLSAACMALAILLTLVYHNIVSMAGLWIVTLLGTWAGLWWAGRIRMIDMPQVVALLNGFGGAASALVAAISMATPAQWSGFSLITAELALVVGMVTLTGSLVAAGKLHKLLGQKPVIWPFHQGITGLSLLAALAGMAALLAAKGNSLFWLFFCALASGVFGVVFAIRIGGADMPIAISLLNSLSGVAGSIAGMAISDPLLVSVGGIVGASGLLLTQVMCRAMNRSLLDILSGKSVAAPSPKDMAASPDAEEARQEGQAQEPTQEKPSPKALLEAARRVIIIPGYGMALAQAQEKVKRLADRLEEAGVRVDYAIHPVAGRMPGHMNILLAEVDTPYDKLREMEDINPEFKDCDVAVIIGANDVVNPAANTAQGTPIYGMPVLDAALAKHILILNYDSSPGYSGVPNPLYQYPNAILLLGDASQTLDQLLE